MITTQRPVTHTFIHLVPIKDQSSGLFMMLFAMGGKTATAFPFTSWPRKRVFVVNLTQARKIVQFSCGRSQEIFTGSHSKNISFTTI
jgi:hypothetical protein